MHIIQQRLSKGLFFITQVIKYIIHRRRTIADSHPNSVFLFRKKISRERAEIISNGRGNDRPLVVGEHSESYRFIY